MSRVLHRSGALPPVAIRGEGIYLYTEDGHAIIDGSGGAAVACLGHGNRRIAEPGLFDLWVGQSSTGGLHGQFTLYAASGGKSSG